MCLLIIRSLSICLLPFYILACVFLSLSFSPIPCVYSLSGLCLSVSCHFISWSVSFKFVLLPGHHNWHSQSDRHSSTQRHWLKYWKQLLPSSLSPPFPPTTTWPPKPFSQPYPTLPQPTPVSLSYPSLFTILILQPLPHPLPRPHHFLPVMHEGVSVDKPLTTARA